MTTVHSDEDLAARAAAGDQDAYLTLYERYVTPIYRFVYFRARSKESAEDIVSEVFLKAWKYRTRFTPIKGGTYKSWLYTIARRQIIDTMRKQKPAAPLEEIFGLGTTDDHRDPHVQQQLVHAIEKLTPMQQDVVRLRFWHQLSYDEIAHVLDKSAQSCRAHGSRGIRALRDTLPAELFILLFCISSL